MSSPQNMRDVPPVSRGSTGINVDPSDRAYRRSGSAESVSVSSGNWLSRLIRPAIVLVIAGVCAGGLFLAYSRLSGKGVGGGIPLIRAEQSVVKQRADASMNQGDAPDGQNPYTLGQDDPKTERLLPAPEEPLAKPIAPPTPVIAAPLPPQPMAAATAPVVAPLPGAIQQPALSKPLTPPDAVQSMAALTASATAEKPPKSTITGGLRVQIAATKDEATAQKEWQRLQKAHPDLLQDLNANIVMANLGDRGVFYRVQAGPLTDRATADKLCNALKAYSIGCMIAKPE